MSDGVMRWRMNAARVATVLLVAFMYGLVIAFDLFVLTRADWISHTNFTRQWLETGSPVVTHLVFHSIALIAKTTLSISFEYASLLVGMLAAGGLALILFERLRRVFPKNPLAPYLIFGAVMVLMVVAPIPFITPNRLYIGYIGVTTYHSPTMALMRPMALLLFGFTIAALMGRLRLTWITAVLAVVLSGLTAFSKPNYTISLLPALGLVILYFGWVEWRNKHPLLPKLALPIWIVVVSTAIIGAQYLLQYQLINDSSVTVGIEPFATVWYFDSSRSILIIRFFSSILFPLMVTVLYWRTILRDFVVLFSWLSFAFGAAQMYLLIERGARTYDLNFWWGAQMTLFLLFIVTFEWLVRHWNTAPRWRNWLCLSALTLHVLAGINFYRAQFYLPLY